MKGFNPLKPSDAFHIETSHLLRKSHDWFLHGLQLLSHPGNASK